MLEASESRPSYGAAATPTAVGAGEQPYLGLQCALPARPLHDPILTGTLSSGGKVSTNCSIQHESGHLLGLQEPYDKLGCF